MAGGGEVRRNGACRGGCRGRRRRRGRRGGRGRDIGRSLDVDHQAGWPAQLEHPEAGGRLETDPVTDHAFEVADVRDFADFGQTRLEVARHTARDLTVMEDGADSRRAFKCDWLTTGVADKGRVLSSQLILRDRTGRGELEDEAVIAVVMRHADGG